MARIARIVAPGIPHHVTARGNRFAELIAPEGDEAGFAALRAPEGTDRPLGTPEFIAGLERVLGRRIARRAPERKPRGDIEDEPTLL